MDKKELYQVYQYYYEDYNDCLDSISTYEKDLVLLAANDITKSNMGWLSLNIYIKHFERKYFNNKRLLEKLAPTYLLAKVLFDGRLG